MKGYVNLPTSIHYKLCKECGAPPVIAMVDDIGYVVKCSKSNDHYQTMPGLIDIEDWNRRNTLTPLSLDYNLNPTLAW